ncbi:MAG TPA: M20/M25/M40 family metallo-hydrolase [Thermoanaerobaculia bacterium]
MRRTLTVVVPLLAVLALAVIRRDGPAPRDAAAPPNVFSAARAMNELRNVLGDQQPHPIGTPANAAVRERIAARFRSLGYEVRVQQRFACNAVPLCGNVNNIVAARGGGSGDTVLVTAHYDSVPAGPGASDDGMGVAALLEVARAVRDERFANRVVFLVDDGEESGLLGAEGFVADESLARDVAVVINVENRGTEGSSTMFETSRGNRWLIRHLAHALPRPQASSLFFAIYDLLPNDTDVTVYKRAGKAAVNFAAIGGVNRYHTPLDNLANVSARTLQHHGDNVLATLRALASADLAARSNTDATYFDLLGFVLVWWPQEWTLWLAIVSLVLLVFGARRMPPRAMTFGVIATFATIVLALIGGAALSWLARLHSSDINWVAHPLAPVVSMWTIGIAAALTSFALARRRAEALPLLYGAAIVWHAMAIALALTMPGASYLLLVPAFAVTCCALARASDLVTSAVAAAVSALLLFPLAVTLYDALGGRLIAAIALLMAIFATLVAPLVTRVRAALAFVVAAAICAVVALLQPAVTREKPRFVTLTYADDSDDSTATWSASPLTPALERAAAFRTSPNTLTPWNGGTRRTAVAPRIGLQRVLVTGERRGERVALHVRSQRNANRVIVIFRGDVASMRVNGVNPPPAPARFQAPLDPPWHVAVVNGTSMDLELVARGPIEATATDVSFGLPPIAAPLLRARAASTAVPVHDGDQTITRARLRL